MVEYTKRPGGTCSSCGRGLVELAVLVEEAAFDLLVSTSGTRGVAAVLMRDRVKSGENNERK